MSKLHVCSLCKVKSPLRWSNINLLIPGKDVVYAAPAGIVHYINDHQYLPPREFIEAVDRCPDYGLGPYLLALRQANGGRTTPLKTRDESVKETRENLLRAIESRKTRDRK